MESCEMQFDVMSQKLITQELRISQRALEELKKEYEALKVREQSLIEGARWERGRTKAQEDRATSLQKELEKCQEEKESIQKEKQSLQKELSNSRRQSSDHSSRTQLESEIINYRTKIAGLESKLSRRQAEFERSEEALRNEIEKLQSMIDSTQFRLVNESTSEKENLDSSNVEQMNQLHYKMGSLTATNESLREEITRHLTDKADMEHEIKNLKEELDSAKNMIKILQDRLTETEGSNDFASKYWSEEMNKVKNQKAEIRVELLKLKKEHQKLLQDVRDGTAGKTNHDSTKYEAEISELKQQVKEYRSKLDESQRLLAEMESSGKGEVEQLKSELLKSNEKITKMKDALTTLDNQAEELLNSVKTENAAKKAAKKKIAALEKELTELQTGEFNRKALEEELASLKIENDRLIDKIAYLENEIKETHTDHREELAKLAKQLTAHRASTASQDTRQKEELSKKILQLESTIRQHESVVRSLNRMVEQSKAEVTSAENTLSDMREKQCNIVSENTELRKALNEAILKIKSHADKAQSLTTTLEEQKNQISRLTEIQSQLRDEISELRDELRQKEENIAYLQSIVQPRKLEKLKITHSQSTLVTGPADDPELEQLMQKRTELAREVAEKAKALEQKKEQIVPLMKNISGCSGSSSVDVSRCSSPTSSRSRIGTMRHDIPHRWSKTLALWMPPKCESCYEAMPMFSYILRCKSCSLVVHPHCQSAVLNTCGLPTACANFYVDHHSVSSENMSGWVKIWRSNETPGSKWCNAFAVMEGNKLAFYETDVALAQNDAPMMTVDLSQERWRIYNQTGTVKGIESANADCLIEIKLKNLSLFMLTRTSEAKRAWIQALQNATDRRILERNGSNRRIMSMSVILRMGQPLLKFQCTQVYDDWLLIGTPQGLFATSFSHPRMPFQVAGFSNVLQMKFIKEHNLLFAIDGMDRNVVAVRSQQLDSALNANSAPFIQPTAYSHLPAAHLIEVSEIQHCKERYLYVATTEGITVLHYIPKKDMFVPTAEIKLEVPAMCIVSCKGGFVFGSDTFYFVEAGRWNPCSFRADWPPDLPIGVVKISEEEILIVNHNCGVFTTPQGRRTREGIVEWDRIPLSVTFVEPYLFIVYTNMISVARVLPSSECNSEDSPLIEELEGYRAPMAHVTGFGKSETDVLVTVMNDSCVELNCFSASKQTLKRKTTASISYLQPSKKRS